jgi:hypothetical protein
MGGAIGVFMPFYSQVDVPENSRRCTSAWGVSGGVALWEGEIE